MRRVKIGGVIIGYSLILIAANHGTPDQADLILGIVLLPLGLAISVSGAYKLLRHEKKLPKWKSPEWKSRERKSPSGDASTVHRGRDNERSATQRIVEGTMISVLGGVITGIIMKLLGG